MTLPVINTPSYNLNVPSTDQEITYRPFLVKEEKLLLIAQETGDEKSTYNAIKNIIKQCVTEDLDIEKMPLFDLEYIFLNIRAKSVGEVAKLKVKAPDDGETIIDIEVDLTEVVVQMPEGHDPRIQVTEDIGLLMSYPTMGSVNNMNRKDKSDADSLFEMICGCMYQIWQGEEVFDCMDYTNKDKMKFLDSLNHQQFEKVQEFFNTMPTLKHEIEVTNPKTKKKSTLTLEGMNSFF
tara:strand:- start:292 stop:999 length:708 start_codon:yes stop_codon:yes gene_type:complete